MEHYRSEIEDVGYRFSLVNGEIQKCIGTYCVQCDFYKSKFENCNGNRIYWLMSEYKPEPVLTAREKNFVEFAQEGWLARDEDNGLWWYEDKPIRACMTKWSYRKFAKKLSDKPYNFEQCFRFITWEDEEPWSVEDLRKLKALEYNPEDVAFKGDTNG